MTGQWEIHLHHKARAHLSKLKGGGKYGQLVGSYLETLSHCLCVIHSALLKSRLRGHQCDRDSVAGIQPLCKAMLLVKDVSLLLGCLSRVHVLWGAEMLPDSAI